MDRYAFAPTTSAVIAVGVLESLDVLSVPSLRSLLSCAVKEHEQGSALAVIANVETLVNLVIPIGMGQVYAQKHQLPFLVLAVVALGFCLGSLRIKTNPKQCIERLSTTRGSLVFGGSFVDVVPADDSLEKVLSDEGDPNVSGGEPHISRQSCE